jgi:TATA-box binding protein (TBP) (component of TFIID and TFIIIB)
MVFKRLCEWIQGCMNYKEEEVEITNIRIGMINSNFNIKCGVDLQCVQCTLNNNDEFYSRYDPDSYPAINIKYKKIMAISIFIFGSGNIVITGSKNIRDIQTVYNVINRLLESSDKHYKHGKGKTKTNNSTILYGYNLKQLLSAVV